LREGVYGLPHKGKLLKNAFLLKESFFPPSGGPLTFREEVGK